MNNRPHYEKIKAAIENPLSKDDVAILKEILKEYDDWIKKLDSLKLKGDDKVREYF